MKGRSVVGVVVLCTALSILGVLDAETAAAQFTFERSPAEGPRGTVIKVSGTGCIENGKPYEYAYLFFSYAEPGGQPYDTSQQYPIRPDGTWAGDFVVPQDAPTGHYGMRASCVADDQFFLAGESTFFVNSNPPIPPPSTATTSTTSATTTSTSTPRTTSTTARSSPPVQDAKRSATTTSQAAAAPAVEETTSTTDSTVSTSQVGDSGDESASAVRPRPEREANGNGPILLRAVLVLALLIAGASVFVRWRGRHHAS